MERPLEGRVALVTGGGVRLGRALAEGLGRAGASVAVHFNASRAGADAAVATLSTDGNRAAAFQADLSGTPAAEALLAQVEDRLGKPSILVNSAALFDRAPLVDTTDESLDRLWAVNARGPYVLTRAFARGMRGSTGDVLNIVDIGGGLVPWTNFSAYCMTKAALTMLTRCLAVELAPDIRVNAVAPGTVLPPDYLGAPELETLRQRIPQKRFGAPEDVVRAALFLLTGPRFVTGQVIAVDGGRSLGSGG